MKKISFLLSFALILGLGACKCTTCTKDGGSEARICEKDYDSNTAYGFAIDAYEAMGYDCGK